MPRPKGLPKTGGKQKGSRNKRTIGRETAQLASGLGSIDFLISVFRDESCPISERVRAAGLVAPFERPKLTSVEFRGELNATLTHEMAILALK